MKRMKSSHETSHKVKTQATPPNGVHNGFIIGSSKSKSKVSAEAANDNNGMVIGPAIKKGKSTPSMKALNKLPGKRQDGKL